MEKILPYFVNIVMSKQQMQKEENPLVASQAKHKSTYQLILISCTIALSSFYFGYTLIYMGAIPFKSIIIIYNITMNQGTAQGILNGCIPIGALFGALGSSLLIARYSRRNCILITNALAFVIGILIYIQNFYSFLVFRFFQGVFVGIFSAVAPMMVRQIAPDMISGMLGTLVQINITGGIMLGYLFTYCLKKITGDLSCLSFWEYVFGLPLFVMVAQSLLLIFVYPYQTPKYLLLKNRTQDARKLIQMIFHPQYVDEIMQEKQKEVQKMLSHTSSPLQTVLSQSEQSITNKKGKVNLAFIMAVHVAIFQQFSGVNAFNIYCGQILNKNMTFQLALIMPTMMTTQKLLTTFITSVIIKKYGRKTLLEYGLLFAALGSGCVALGFMLESGESSSSESLIIFGLFFFMGIFGLTLGPISWLYISETIEPKYNPIATCANWTSSSLVILLFPIIKQNVLRGNPGLLFVIFTCWSLASFIVNRFFLLQTKDKTQLQIKLEYIDYSPC